MDLSGLAALLLHLLVLLRDLLLLHGELMSEHLVVVGMRLHSGLSHGLQLSLIHLHAHGHAVDAGLHVGAKGLLGQNLLPNVLLLLQIPLLLLELGHGLRVRGCEIARELALLEHRVLCRV